VGKKYFIITIDTEGDNLWEYKEGDIIQTNNALYIPRFQDLCEKYGLKPVYFTNYEMIMSSDFVQFIKPKVEAGLCEVGVHIHAWNNPPYHDLKGPYNGNPYLIEYPYDVMRDKFKVTYDLICDKIGIPPVSHRAGRWAMNESYFNLLKEFNIKVDCSYTPGIDWSRSMGRSIANGPDYTNVKPYLHYVHGILEIPVSIRKMHATSYGGYKHKAKVFLFGNNTWLRPTNTSLIDILSLCKKILAEKGDYLEFMLHSSEFMPGGSPTYKTQEDIDNLFSYMETLFAFLHEKGCIGLTFQEYCKVRA